MVQLTVSCKGKLLNTYRFDGSIVTIGRDPNNTICLDDPSLAPKHVTIDLDHPKGPQLIREDVRFPVEVNGRPTDCHVLAHGDTIRLGEYILRFADDRIPPPAEVLQASLQILNGKHIGRIIPLKHALTRLGNHGSVAVIARRKNGYFLSSLTGGENIKVNGHPLGGQTIQLNGGDKLEIDHCQFLFHR